MNDEQSVKKTPVGRLFALFFLCHIVSCGKVRGNKKAYAELADYFDKRALDKTARIGIAHADNREGTDYLLGLLRERGFTGECLEVYYEPVTGAHVGPGTVALFFYGTEK